MELGYVLRRAWRITWEHRRLWAFGFLVSLGMVGTRLGLGGGQWEPAVQELPPDLQQPIVDFLNGPHVATAAAILALVGFVVGVGLSVLGALGRVGLVHQTRAAEDYGIVVLKGGWLAGKRHLWQVFFIRLLLGLPAGLVLLAGMLPTILARPLIAGQGQSEIVAVLAALGFGFTCLVPAVCASFLLSIPTVVLQRLAVRACVLERLGVRASIARAWETLREYLGWVALVWLILSAIDAGVVIVVGLPLVVVWWLLFSATWLTALFSPLLSAALTLLLGLATWLAASAVGGVAETFSSATWTLAYRELTGMGRTGEETALSL